MANWENYHFTRTMDVSDHRRFNADGTMQPSGTTTGPEMFASSCRALFDHVKDAVRLNTQCGIIGKAWSFSELTGNRALQLDCGGKLSWENELTPGSGLHGVAPFDAGALNAKSTLPADHLAWARGGTTMRDLAVWAEKRDLSLSTSGDQLGPSLAGAVATGTHGSRLGYGAVQNMVRGLHIVTGTSSSVWLEPASHPVLTDATAALFAGEIVRDDRRFNDALLHLGGMGIINGAIIELEPKGLFNKRVPIVRLEPIWDEWLVAVQARDFAKVASLLGVDGNPIFYEFSLNPFDMKGKESVHILYFPSQALLGVDAPARTPRASDAVYYLADLLQHEDLVAPSLDLPALYIALVRQDLASPYPKDALPWSALHRSDVESGARGALFNAGFAVPFDQLSKAMATMTRAVEPLSTNPQFIFTYRFVTHAAGTLAHLRWDESVAIELDGASRMFANQYRVIQNSAVALDLVQRAFEAAGVDYCMHWGKLGNTAALVAKNFGSAVIAGSPIQQWGETRSELLASDGIATMKNDFVTEYGLV